MIKAYFSTFGLWTLGLRRWVSDFELQDLRASVFKASGLIQTPLYNLHTSPFLMLKTGARLGPYEVVGALGAGGMGEVYRARDTKLGREVAIKILSRRVRKP
jgi:serine/threonine protein kinase